MTDDDTIRLVVPEVPLAETGDERERADYLSETSRRVMDSLNRRVPHVFEQASITHPVVAQWAQGLVEAAMRPTGPRANPLRPGITRGSSLLLLGGTGTGKSWLAWGAVRQLTATGLLRGWEYITEPDLHAEMRPRAGSDGERRFREIVNVPLLVVDDLGAAKASEWTAELLFRLVNARYESARPTVWTSNLTGPELRDGLGDRVASRLRTARHVSLAGEDRRRRAS